MREGISIEVSAANRERLQRWWRIGIARSMSGERGSFWRQQKAVARRRSCVAPAFRSLVYGAGRNGSCRRRWPVAGQNQKARSATVAGGAGRPRGRADAYSAAWRGDALDRPDDGRGCRYIAALGAADLGGAPPAAAPGVALQDIKRAGVAAVVVESLANQTPPTIAALDRWHGGNAIRLGITGEPTYTARTLTALPISVTRFHAKALSRRQSFNAT